jgi:hypothetical protein
MQSQPVASKAGSKPNSANPPLDPAMHFRRLQKGRILKKTDVRHQTPDQKTLPLYIEG